MTPPTAVAAGAEARVRDAWQERTQRPGYRPPAASFEGRRVLTLESRRSPELALLVVNYGGEPVIAPAVREVALDANRAALEFVERLLRSEYDMVVLMTGVGTRMLLRLVEPSHGRDAFIRALAATPIVARGPKPVAALREIGVMPWLTAPSPNTWREVLATLDMNGPHTCGGARIAVQEYGMLNPELLHGLVARGADVCSVPIYKWALPDDVEPLRFAIRELIDGRIDVVMLTASVQLTHLLQVAAGMRLEDAVRSALAGAVIASIGPMTSEELSRQGLQIDLETSHPKMGYLVKEAAEQCAALLSRKRASAIGRA